MRIRAVLTATAPVAAALALATPALASPTSGATPGAGGVRGGPASGTAIHDANFAGWEVTASDGGFSETTTIVLPKLKCHSAAQAIDPNVGTLINSESSYDDAGVFVGCVHGKARYFPAFTVEGSFQNFPKLKAQAGDAVVLKEVLSTTGKGKLSVVDKTTKSSSKTLTVPKVTDSDFPWVGDSGWTTTTNPLLPVPNFGKITFSHTRFVRQPMRKAFPGTELAEFDRYNGSTPQIKTSKWGSDQETFKTAFEHS